MTILHIDHVEFYVDDADRAVEPLCSGYGFRVYGHGGPETGLPGQRSVLIGQGDIRLVFTSGLHPQHPASRFVARHGDGVAVTAFRTDDAAQTYADALTTGGTGLAPPRDFIAGDDRVVTADLVGFGDVVHRLVERHGSPEEFLPGRFGLHPEARPEPGTTDALQIVDHIAICVPSGELEPTVRRYEEVYGFAVTFQEYIEVGDQAMNSKVVQSPTGGVTFTILEPDTTRSRGQIDDFLAWHDGAGVQHLAFLTDDIVDAVQTIGGRGVQFAQTPPVYYDMLDRRLGPTEIPVEALRPLGILVDRDHWGQLYQIFARSTHERRTYFHELIGRSGARTFGTSNIPALYAAKERELAEIRDQAGAASL